MELKEYLKEYRDSHDLSQRQFAEACGLSNGYISMIERGYNPKTKEPITCSLPTLQKLAAGMHISLNQLLTDIDDMPVDLTAEDHTGNRPALKTESRPIDPIDIELYDIIAGLPQDKKMEALHYLRYLAASQAH